MSIVMYDTIEMDDKANVVFKEDGRMTAYPRIARTGIQFYRGSELGLKDDRASKVFRVYRSEAQVFSKDTVASFLHRAVTNDHPPEPVTADNFTQYAKGWTGDETLRDGQYMRVPMMFADAKLVKDYKDGKRQLSNGYTCDIKWEAGTSPDGEVYDAEQIDIRGNHVAVVTAARGGDSLTIGDDNHMENDTMTTQTSTIMIDGANLTVDAVTASVIQAHIGRMNKSIEALQSKLEETETEKKKQKDAADAALATAATQLATKDAEIVTLKKLADDNKITPAMLDSAVRARAGVMGRAKAILGDKLVVGDKSDLEIMRQVVDARLGDAAKGWNEVQVGASFASITADVKPGDAAIQVGDAFSNGHRPGYTVADVARAFSQPGPQVDAVDKAYQEYDTYLGDAWKSTASKVA